MTMRVRHVWPLLVISWNALTLGVSGYGEHHHEDLPIGGDLEEVRVVEGQNATLPCRVDAPLNDAPILTLWYINEKETPVYSYDERPRQKPSHWFDPDVFGHRGFYQAQWTPPSLEIVHTERRDGKLYRCRVDFSHSNSRVAWVKLNIIVPPENMDLKVRTKLVKLGDSKDVVCRAVGGSPSPQVLWFQEGEVVDSSFTTTEQDVFNVLNTPASRSDLRSSFVCQALNNDLKRPKDLAYLRNVICGPLSVSITAEEEPLREGRTVKLVCTVIGSNPPAEVSWYYEGHQPVPLKTKVTETANVTTSSLTLNVTRDDHGRHLACRAVNKLLASDPVEDTYAMNVAYKPLVRLSLGRSLDPSSLREGNDVFFECSIDANPSPYKVAWYHDGHLLSHNVSTGVLVSKTSLALQKVTLNSSGQYVCKASNVEGDTLSEPTEISIKYAPRCRVTPSLKGVALRESVNVTCEVEADPEEVKFFWTFNNSARKEQSETVPNDRFVSSGLRSTLFYSPTTERDYGTLLCYAQNAVGRQRKPCSFTVISAGPPEAVTGCSFENVTSHSSSVICSSGFNGGLPQRFLLQVWTNSGEQVVNYSSPTPEFLVRSLAPDHQYAVAVTSFNSRGAAQPTRRNLHTLKEAEMHKSLPSRTAPSALTLVLGVIGGAMLAVLSLLVAMWAVKGRRRQEQPPPSDFSSNLMFEKQKLGDASSFKADPDILQSRIERKHDSPLEEGDKSYTISSSQLRSHNPLQVQVSPGRCMYSMIRVPPDSPPLAECQPSDFSQPQGLGRGLSLLPSGLERGLGRAFGSVNSIDPQQEPKDPLGVDYFDRRRGCTRRAMVGDDDVGVSHWAHKPLITGGESVL